MELGTSCEDKQFEGNLQETTPQILLGLKSGSLLSHQMAEEEIINANLSIPIFSPEIQVWKTPLNNKLLITGTCGVNKELIGKNNNLGFNETARMELGTSCEDQQFEWIKKRILTESSNDGGRNLKIKPKYSNI